jgi:RimJ/RimL family protein N-acetyltransferase
MAVPEIATDRLRLRGWRDDDREPWAALNADPEVMTHFPTTLSRATCDRLVDLTMDGWAESGFGLWALERVEDGIFLGFTGLSRPSFEAHFTPAVEVGWRLARHAWGHGFATEAARAALEFGFETVGLEEIVSFTVPQNVRSRQVMQRIGLVRDPAGDFQHPAVDPVRYPHLVAHVLYRLSREAWESRPFRE